MLRGLQASTNDLEQEKTAFLNMYQEACNHISPGSSPEAQRAVWKDLLQRHNAHIPRWELYKHNITEQSQWWLNIGEQYVRATSQPLTSSGS